MKVSKIDGNSIEILELEDGSEIPEGYVEYNQDIQDKYDEIIKDSYDKIITSGKMTRIVQIDENDKILNVLNFEGYECPSGYYPLLDDSQDVNVYLEPLYSHENKSIIESASSSRILEELQKDDSQLGNYFKLLKKNKIKDIVEKIDIYVSENSRPVWEIICEISSLEGLNTSDDIINLKKIKDEKTEIIQKINDCISFEELDGISFEETFLENLEV